MRKCKQVVSLLLVLCMMFAVISVGIVQGAAADTDQIYQDPPHDPALLGDIDRNGLWLDMLVHDFTSSTPI